MKIAKKLRDSINRLRGSPVVYIVCYFNILNIKAYPHPKLQHVHVHLLELYQHWSQL